MTQICKVNTSLQWLPKKKKKKLKSVVGVQYLVYCTQYLNATVAALSNYSSKILTYEVLMKS